MNKYTEKNGNLEVRPYQLLLTLAILAIFQCCFSHTNIALAAPPSPIVINEIQYHPADDVYETEYIELYNRSLQTVALDRWVFSDGIQYTFPTGTVILPGDYLVIASNPDAVTSTYGITGVLGPFESGKLSNSGERIALSDTAGTLVDEVNYDDHAPWPESPDGNGPSLELINYEFNNNSPCSWQGSTGTGSPGRQNTVYMEGNLPPCVTNLSYTPTLPLSTDFVVVTVNVEDNDTVDSVTLYYNPQYAESYTGLIMVDDGTGWDNQAGDGLYTAAIPPRSFGGTLYLPGQGTYIEFYVTAMDNEGVKRTIPEGSPGIASKETGNPLTLSGLVWVEDAPPDGPLPIYRIIATDENMYELHNRSLFSNELLDATFIYKEQIYLNVGLRYRGESTRDSYPRPYRIKFRDDQEFDGRERVNLVSDYIGRESLAHGLFQRAGLIAPDTQFVSFYINGGWEGYYLDVEQVDRDFLTQHLGDDNDGNLYRGYDGANLKYRGPEGESYAPYYLKKTNEDEDDYTDIISLTYALDPPEGVSPPEQTFFREDAESLANMRQWLKWFAVQAVLDNQEGALWKGQGDDYFLYHRGLDDRFILISWDHDSTFRTAENTIWVPDSYVGGASSVVRRILNYPRYTRWYYQGIAEIIEGPFSEEEMLPLIDALPDVVDHEEKDRLRNFVRARIPHIWAEMPNDLLTIETNGGADLVTTDTEVTLEGRCSVLRDVAVNHSKAGVEYYAPTGNTHYPIGWRYTATLNGRDNSFEISDGQDTYTFAVYRDLYHGGELTQSMTLEASGLPYTIREDIVLSGNITLTVEPGTTLHFEGDRYIRVSDGARLLAQGTAQRPIVFRPANAGQYWGGILFYNTRADNVIQYATLEYIHEVIQNPRSHGVTGYASNFTIADSTLRHMRRSNAVTSNSDSRLTLLRNDIYDIGSDAVHPTGGYAYIQGNTIHDSYYDPSFNPAPPEAMELSDMITTAIVLDNQFYNITDDCLDMNHSSAYIARNIFHNCGDKGISIGHPSSSTLINNLVYDCYGNPEFPDTTGFAIALKDGAVARLVNNTLANNRHGLGLYEMHPGEGGATATVINTIIWGNDNNLELRDGSTISVSHSTIQGGWPGMSNYVDLDPLFSNPDRKIYYLQEGSPCIDTGTLEGAPATDLAGITRPKGEGIDQGVYEFFTGIPVYLPLVRSGE